MTTTARQTYTCPRCKKQVGRHTYYKDEAECPIDGSFYIGPRPLADKLWSDEMASRRVVVKPMTEAQTTVYGWMRVNGANWVGTKAVAQSMDMTTDIVRSALLNLHDRGLLETRKTSINRAEWRLMAEGDEDVGELMGAEVYKSRRAI